MSKHPETPFSPTFYRRGKMPGVRDVEGLFYQPRNNSSLTSSRKSGIEGGEEGISTNFDIVFLRAASEPNLKAKSKLRAKVSEHRSYLGSVVVPRRRERIGNRITKSTATGMFVFTSWRSSLEQGKNVTSLLIYS